MHPLDIDMGLLSGSRGALQRDAGHIDRGDLPASAGQPHGVGSLATAHVEGGTRFEVAHFGDQGGVGFTSPHLLGACVPFVPCSVASVDWRQAWVPVSPRWVTMSCWLGGRVRHRVTNPWTWSLRSVASQKLDGSVPRDVIAGPEILQNLGRDRVLIDKHAEEKVLRADGVVAHL